MALDGLSASMKVELAHRAKVLAKLEFIYNEWVGEFSLTKNEPKSEGKVLPFGSYVLGAHTKGADLDTLCIGPKHIDHNDFFGSFHKKLSTNPEVKNLYAIPEAYVPLIKMVFDGVEMDVLYVGLTDPVVPANLALHNTNILRGLDGRSTRSVAGWRLNDSILHLVPNLANFRLVLRAVKIWAKSKGVYSGILGFLGGTSWAILVSYTCKSSPTTDPCLLLLQFFHFWANWPWPKPVRIKLEEKSNLNLKCWTLNDPLDRTHLMPIITPMYPAANSSHNVSKTALAVMLDALRDGRNAMMDIMTLRSDWPRLFERSEFFSLYEHYAMVTIVSQTKERSIAWKSYIESRLRHFVRALEEYFVRAHVYPLCFGPREDQEHALLKRWFIGLYSDTVTDPGAIVNLVGQDFVLRVSGKQPLSVASVEYCGRKDIAEYIPDVKEEEEDEDEG